MNRREQTTTVMAYKFRSTKVMGTILTILSVGTEAAARHAAMEHLWGPPSGWCHNKGIGLRLVDTRPVTAAELTERLLTSDWMMINVSWFST